MIIIPMISSIINVLVIDYHLRLRLYYCNFTSKISVYEIGLKTVMVLFRLIQMK